MVTPLAALLSTASGIRNRNGHGINLKIFARNFFVSRYATDEEEDN